MSEQLILAIDYPEAKPSARFGDQFTAKPRPP
jgi:hypothetical protein